MEDVTDDVVRSARLDAVASDLSGALDRASAARLRAIAASACEWAVAGTGLAEVRIENALDALRHRRVGDSPVRDALRVLVDVLDEHAWDVQDAAEVGGATAEDHVRAYRRARAASAVWFALDPDALLAAQESLYEVHAATGDLAGVRLRVQELLG